MLNPDYVQKRVFLSAPAHNEIQQVGVGTITKSIEAVGFECVYPSAPVLEKGQGACVRTRMDLLKSCDMLVTWIDGLLPEGLVIAAMTDVQAGITIPFEGQIKNVVDAGWQALGGAPAMSQKKMILLPGEAPSAQDAPKSMTVNFPAGRVTAQMCSPPINLPEGNTLIEAGIAMGLGIPVLVVALGPAAAGDYLLPRVIPMVGAFEALDIALKQIKEATSIEAGLASILQGNIDDMKAMEEKEENGELLQSTATGEEATQTAESPVS